MRATQRGIGFFFVSLALLFSAVLFRDFALYSILLVVLLVIAAEALWVKLATRKPESKFILSRPKVEQAGGKVILYPGDESEEKVLFTKKVGGRAELLSRIEFLSFEPRNVVRVGRSAIGLRFSTEYAGEYSGDEVDVTVTGPLGLFSTRTAVPLSVRYVVYPRVLQVAAATVKLLGKGELGEAPIQMPGVGSEYYEMRAYQPGDDFRNVNWKATAREGELTVVEHMREVGSSFLVVMDARAPGFRETDRLASTFLSMANSLGAAGVSFGVLVHDGRRVMDVSSQQDPRASLAIALKAAVGVTKLDASAEFLELVPVGTSSKFAAGGGFGEGSVLSQMSEVRRAELRSAVEKTDPWATASRYIRETQTRNVIYVSGLFGEAQPLIELAWETRHYRDAEFEVANPCDSRTEESPTYRKLAKALSAAGIRYFRGEPVDLARTVLTG